jgi:hypothetical protein
VESTLPVLICLVIVFIGIGLLQVFARDLMWEFTHWSNQAAGRASERTETWESMQVISGVLLILFGAGFGCWGFSMNAERNQQNVQLTAIYSTIEANDRGLAATLDSEFGEIIPTLQNQASTETQRVRSRELGLDVGLATELEYGFCDSDETFYLYVLNYRGREEEYAFLPTRTTPSYCQPPDWIFHDVEEIGQSAFGGTWYSIDFPLGIGRPETSTPKPAATRTPTPSP